MQLTDKLAPNFTFGELTATKQTSMQEQNRQEALAYLDNGRALAAFLQVIRDHFGPVNVHSGFRCPALNGSTPGASKKSQHMLFQACDFDVPGHTLQEVFDWIRKESGLKYGQVILEGRTPGGSPTWIHVSLGEPWRAAKLCRQQLIYDGKTYKTSP